MRISVRRWGASLAALLLVAIGMVPLAARADEGDGTAWLGVYTQELSSDLQEALDHDGDAVLVTRVVDGSPADRAGIRKGDLIVRVESEGVGSPGELAQLIQKHDAGDQVSIQIERDGDRRTLHATLTGRGETAGDGDRVVRRYQIHKDQDGEMHGHEGDAEDHDGDLEGHDAPRHGHDADRDEDNDGQDGDGGFNLDRPNLFDAPDAPGGPMGMGMGTGPRLGVRIESLTPNLAEYFDVKDGGVLVVDVMKDTPAERIGMKAGDVIVRVDGRDIGDSDDLVRAVQQAKGRVSLIVVRHGSRRTFETELRSRGPETRVLRLRRPDGPGNSWRFDGNGWGRGLGAAPPANQKDRAAMEKEIRELKEELKELKGDLKELQDR